MVPVPGKPVMEYLIEHLARHGATLYRGDNTAQLRWGDARA